VLPNKACRPLLLALAVTACEPEVEVESTSDWMLGTFSNTYPRNSTIGLTSVGHYEFRADGTLRVIALTGCEANSEEPIHEYTWRRAGDSRVIVDVAAPETPSVQAWIVTQGEDCNTLQVDEVQDGQLRDGPTLWRGALCMKTLPPCGSVECPSCETVWCDEAPAACEG
jgi:hypothetical protein